MITVSISTDPSRALDAQLYELLTSGAPVLTSSRRLAHWLRAAYAAEAQAQGQQVWLTPQVLPWSAWLRAVCREQRALQADAPRFLSDLQTRTIWEHIVAASPQGGELLNPGQAAANAVRSWQRLHQYRIPVAAISAYPMEETQAFAAWAQAFTERTQKNNWLDGARFAGWLKSTQHLPVAALGLVGFERLTPDMQMLLDDWRGRGCAVHLSEVRLSEVSGGVSSVQVMSAADSSEELECAARWARRQLESDTQRIAVVVPQLNTRADQVRRVFESVFNPSARSIGPSSGVAAFDVMASPSLNTYPLVHHALLLLQLAQGRADTRLIGQLLRSPFFVGAEQEASARALADIRAREDRREHWDLGELARFALATGCQLLGAAIQVASQTAREQRDAALPSTWTERFNGMLKKAGWAQGRSLDSTEQQTRAKFHDVLAELSALDEPILDKGGRINFAQALSYLRDACAAERFAPESSDQPVTVIDADTVSGMEFDALWVMGLHAGDWPPAPQPDAFLPIELQRHYGLPEASAELCLERARAQLQNLVQSAERVVLSWPQHDQDAELRPSPLLAVWPQAATDELSFSRVQEQRQKLFAQRPILESFQDAYAPALLPGQVKGGTRPLELQARCAFRAQAELRLHAAPVPAISLAVEATERGQLTHAVLGELWQQLKDSAGLHALDEIELRRRVQALAERLAPAIIPAATRHRQTLAALEIKLAVQNILALLAVEKLRAPFRVRRAEQLERFEFAGLQGRIQLDRMDELQSGGTLLIDYKTGEGNQASDWLDGNVPGRPRSPQLPLYALMHRQGLAGIAFAVLAPGTAEFRGLARDNGIAPGIAAYEDSKLRAKPEGVDNWDALLLHWRSVLSGLAQNYLAGDARIDPLKGECAYCHLAGVCRIRELAEAEANESDEEGDYD